MSVCLYLQSDSVWCVCYHQRCCAAFHLVCLAKLWIPLEDNDDSSDDADRPFMPSQVPASSTRYSSQLPTGASQATRPSGTSMTATRGLQARLTTGRSSSRPAMPAASQRHHVSASQGASRSLIASSGQPGKSHLSHSFLLPTHGQCPSCRAQLHWGALVRWRSRLLRCWEKPSHGTKSKRSRKPP